MLKKGGVTVRSSTKGFVDQLLRWSISISGAGYIRDGGMKVEELRRSIGSSLSVESSHGGALERKVLVRGGRTVER